MKMLNKIKNKLIKWLGGYTVDELIVNKYIVKQEKYNIQTLNATYRRASYVPRDYIENRLLIDLTNGLEPYVTFEDYYDFDRHEYVTNAMIKVCGINETISNNY